MLRYLEFGISHQEVPGETSICIYITGCNNRCDNCHYPELQVPTSGLILRDHINDIIDLYGSQASCVCFLGEGEDTRESREELKQYAMMVRNQNLKCCLYCGRDIMPEEWMKVFDYVKTGSYIGKYGDIRSNTTNQRFYVKRNDTFVDETFLFWEQ